jgi:hypothetical protein
MTAKIEVKMGQVRIASLYQVHCIIYFISSLYMVQCIIHKCQRKTIIQFEDIFMPNVPKLSPLSGACIFPNT